MLGPVRDARPLMPTAEYWALTGGAYRDGQEIVLPQRGAWAGVWVPCIRSIKEARWMMLQILVPAVDGDLGRVYRAASYYAADRRTTATPTIPASGNVTRPSASDEWGSSAVWEQWPGVNVWWMQLAVSVSSAYGTPGTRFIPGPDDLTVTY